MVRPYIDPAVNVTASGRWITRPGPGLAAYTYTALEGYSTMFLGLGLISYVWGGCFSVRRRAFADWELAKRWEGTEDDDLILCNALNEHRQKPVFVPTAVSPSFEAHTTLRGFARWFVRQGQTARLHYFRVWLLLLVVETAMCLGLLGAAALAAADLAAGHFSWRAGAGLASFLMAMAGGILVKAPYAERKDMPLIAWALVPLFGHFFAAVCFWLSVNPKMRWGKTILEFNKDGTIRSMSST